MVNDEKPIVRLVTFNLEKEGFITFKAYNGEDALQIIDDEKPDLVILDLMLPRIDGLEVCRQICQKQISTAIIYADGQRPGNRQGAGSGIGSRYKM